MKRIINASLTLTFNVSQTRGDGAIWRRRRIHSIGLSKSKSLSKSGSKKEGGDMALGHKKRDVYRLSNDGYIEIDFDPDSDFDPEENKS